MLKRKIKYAENYFFFTNLNININVSGLEQGVYSVILVCDGIARDVKTLVVQ